MINERIAAILIFALVLTCFLGLLLLTMLTGRMPAIFYWGGLIGIVFGIGTWFYLAQTWDPINMRPKNEKDRADLRKLWWVVPGGLVLARLLPQLVGQNVTDLLAGMVVTWLFLTLGYAIFQLWRHYPRN